MIYLKTDIYNFLKSIERKDGVFNWTNKYFIKSNDGNLSVQSLALKVIYMSNNQDLFDTQKISNSILNYKSSDGFFRGLFNDENDLKSKVVAETRQGISALKLFNVDYGDLPFIQTNKRYYNINKMKKYLDKLPWDESSYSAGANYSQMVALSYFGKNEEMVDFLYQYGKSKWNGKHWGGKGQKGTVAINGIMKMITAFTVCNRKIPYTREQIDYILNNSAALTGCAYTDYVYSLVECYKKSKYREKEVKVVLNKCKKEIINKFHKASGGFSYRPNATRKAHYKIPIVSKIINQADLHGTVLFLWALVAINEVLYFDDNIRNHQP